MKKFLLALLLLGLPMAGRALPPPGAVLSVNLTSRNLQNTNGDALGFNLPAWPYLVQAGGVFEFTSGSILKFDSGAIISGLTATPGGSNQQLQYNNSGALSGASGALWNGTNLTNLAAPINSADAANKGYVDSAAAGLVVRTAVAVASTGNLTLSGEQTIDGVLTSASRILVKNQTLSQNNGIYTTGAGAWSRASDSNTAGTLKTGYYYFVAAGTTQASTGWTITTAPVNLGTDPVVFSQFSASASYMAGAGLSLGGSTFSVNAAQPGITSVGPLTSLATIDLGTANGSLPALISAPSTPLRFGAQDLTSNVIQADSFGTLSATINILGRNSGGTRGAPSATTSGATMVRMSAYGFDTALTTTASGFYSILAGSQWAAGNRETKHLWSGTPNSSTTLTSWMQLDGANGLQVLASLPFSAAKATVAGELKANYGVFTSPVAAYDSSGGALYLGYNGSAGVIQSIVDNSGNGAPLAIFVGASQVGTITSLGLNGDLGQTNPGKVNVTTLSWASNTNLRISKANGNIIINVKDYGALGNGSANDTVAINSAIAALTNYSTLYFPAGSYIVTFGGGSPTPLSEFNILSHITVMGDGHSSQIKSNETGASGNCLVFHNTCDHVSVHDLDIIGSATVRGSGCGIRMYASYSQVSNVYCYGVSDFGFQVSNDTTAYTISVSFNNCLSDHTLGDGFHLGNCTDSSINNCQAYYTGDDGAGIGDDGAVGFPATRIEVVGFQSIQAGNHAGGGTHGSGIRIFDGALDIHVTGGSIYQSCEAGFQCTRATSTTAYNTRIKVDGLKVYQCIQNAGMYGQINFSYVNQGSITGCWSEAPVSQGCYAFLDCNNLTVTGNTGKDAVVRTFVTDDGTTTNVASTWSNWVFSGNTSLGTPSNESFYFVPATGKTIANLLVTLNTDIGGSSSNYIFTNRLATAAKVVLNTSMTGKAVANGGTGITPSPTTPNY